MTKIKLLDGETGNIYTIDVSDEDAVKASQDMLFATQLLHNNKEVITQNHDESIAETEFYLSSGSEVDHVMDETMQEEIVQEETIQEETMLSDSSQEKDSFRWPHEAILLLLTMYREHEGQIKSGKMTMKKFWMMIASKLVEKDYNVTGSQCKSKMAGLRKTYKNVKDYNSKSGNNIRTWRYFDIMDELFKNRPWAAPVLTLDSSNQTSLFSEDIIDKKRSSSSCKTELPSKRLKQCILLEKVLAVAKESIIERRKMHEEAMARQDKLLNILEKIIKK